MKLARRGKRFKYKNVNSSSLFGKEDQYSPSKLHNSIRNNQRPIMQYERGEFANWKNLSIEKLKELICWRSESFESSNSLLWESVDELALYEKYELRGMFNTYIPIYVCKPFKGFRKRWIICLQGHNSGMHNSIGVDYKHEKYVWKPHGERDIAHWCLKQGYGVVCMEQRALGERRETTQKIRSKHSCQDAAMHALILGQTLLGERLWDIGIVLNYLRQTTNEIDSIGIMGNSLGGTLSIFATVLYEDISFCIASGCFSSFDDSLLRIPHCVDLYIPHLRRYFEYGDIVGLAAPKPMLIIQAVNDGLFPFKGVCDQYKYARKIYKAVEAENRLRLEVAYSGHRFYSDLAAAGRKALNI